MRSFLVVLLFLGTSALDLRAAEPSVKSLQRKILKAYKVKKYKDVKTYADQMAEIGDKVAAKSLFELGLKLERGLVYRDLAKAAAKAFTDESLSFFKKESAGKKRTRLLYLCDVLAQASHPAAPGLLSPVAKRKDIPLIRAAIEALRTMRKRTSVTPLLEILERHVGKKTDVLLEEEARDALFEITHQDFEAIADWKKWWGPIQDSFDPHKKDDGGKTGVKRKSRRKSPVFAGKRIDSKNVVFVIDTSGTMQYVLKDDIPGLQWADGSDSARRSKGPTETLTPKNAILAKFWTRMETAKRRLLDALKDFSSDARVNVVTFDRRVRQFEKRLQKYSSSFKKKTMGRVRTLNYVTVPGTDTLEAIRTAFKCDPRITEIFFLSDGLPSKDGKKNDDPWPLLESIEILNRFRKIKVHTFGFDPKSYRNPDVPYPDLVKANKFLAELAERTGGTFQTLGVTDEKPPKNFR